MTIPHLKDSKVDLRTDSTSYSREVRPTRPRGRRGPPRIVITEVSKGRDVFRWWRSGTHDGRYHTRRKSVFGRYSEVVLKTFGNRSRRREREPRGLESTKTLVSRLEEESSHSGVKTTSTRPLPGSVSWPRLTRSGEYKGKRVLNVKTRRTTNYGIL